jgi:integration host factor subunit beta
MVRSELVTKLAHQYPGVLRKDLERILEIIFLQILEALSRGENIEIRGFGTYKIIKRKARIGRNPKNSQLVQIPEKNAVRWKMSKTFFNRLNKSFTDNKISDTY